MLLHPLLNLPPSTTVAVVYLADIKPNLTLLYVIDSKMNGTVVIVITQQTINQLVDNSAFTFANLKTQKVKRYYVDEDELLTDRNNRFQCFGGKAWTKVDINMKDKLASRLAEIVLHTLEQTGTTDCKLRIVGISNVSFPVQ